MGVRKKYWLLFLFLFNISSLAQVDTAWVRRYNGTATLDDRPSALAVDNNGNVYVTGSSIGTGTGYDYATIKYSPNGDSIWVRRYKGPGFSYDVATALVVDKTGNVYVTGCSREGEIRNDYVTIKYAPNGDTLWVRVYNRPRYSYDDGIFLVVDKSGNVYVTGTIFESESGYDYETIKYSPNGEFLWVRHYNSPANNSDIATALALDEEGYVYVTGRSYKPFDFDFATVKYSPSGGPLWIRRYNGLGNSRDFCEALAVDKNGNVYVSGRSGNFFDDYATIKYVQYACVAKAGDADNDTLILFSDIATLINFLFKSQPAPPPFCRGDANADGKVLLSDIVYLINFLFKSGPAPLKSRECCL